MTTLSVGSGLQYSTISAAIAASHDGDIIQVKAGTYTNDFAVIRTSITLEAVGGQVNMVATKPPPNYKGMFTVGTPDSSPNVTIEGFSFSGVKIPKDKGNNGAGIRYQGGNLSLSHCVFTNNQDGLLATPFVSGTGTISIDSSVFNHNGAGDGYSHNIYVGHVASFTITNSLIENARVGHEIKSRALNTVIQGNRILDTSNGTASYSIDLPNGGHGLVQGNIIEQGPFSQNPKIIAYGEEGSLQPGSLTVTDNLILNEQWGPGAVGIWNDTTVNADISGNRVWGLPDSQLVAGPTDVSGTVDLANEPVVSTKLPWQMTGAATVAAALSAGSTGAVNPILLGYSNTSISGGDMRLTATIKGSNDTVVGGAGGLTLKETGSGLTVQTKAGSTNRITLLRGATIRSAGNDTIAAGGSASFIDVSGAASIKGASAGLIVSNEAGGRATIRGSTGSVTYNGSGGSLDFIGGAGAAHLSLGSGAATVTAGSGNMTLTGGAGSETVEFGGGSSKVTLGSGVARLEFVKGHGGGTDVIQGFNPLIDQVAYQGFSGQPVASQTVSAGSLHLVLTDGTHITFSGITSLT